MAPLAPLVYVANSSVASLLLVAGTSKLSAPAPLAAALEELGSIARLKPSNAFVRCLAGAECLAAIAISLDGARMTAALLMSLWGLGMVGVGIAGIVRGSSMPCGCMGGHRGPTLGTWTLVFGMVLILVWPLNWRYGNSIRGLDYQIISSLLTACGTLLLAPFVHRSTVIALWPLSIRETRTGVQSA
jgi:hypothetical protein